MYRGIDETISSLIFQELLPSVSHSHIFVLHHLFWLDVLLVSGLGGSGFDLACSIGISTMLGPRSVLLLYIVSGCPSDSMDLLTRFVAFGLVLHLPT